jgi:hypothetical protein
MQILYHLIVLYFTIHLIVFLLREKKWLGQLGTAVVLILFILRVFLVK